MNETIFISDLTHTASGIHSAVFPLGAGKICSYGKKNLSDKYKIFLKNISLKIYHNEEQKNHIKNMLNLYPNTKNGKGKMIQRSNFKKINRVAEIVKS